ncbi:MAG: S-methyl-5'-thioinosine phosphorylase [Wenzhouxiangellaceae bacterium]
MPTLGLIAGSGMQHWHDREVATKTVSTPWGEPSTPLEIVELESLRIVQLARHGKPHRIPPHRVNYRANLWALREAGATQVVAVNTVGGISDTMGPGTLLIPDQVLDYTWGRVSSFWDGPDDEPQHIDFTEPYSATLRQQLLSAAEAARVKVVDGGVYAATQGPRLETAAEIRRLQRDGADVVGMTGMPEAALARELGLEFAAIGVSVNWAAGLAGPTLDFEEIESQQKACIDEVARVIWQLCQLLTKIVT